MSLMVLGREHSCPWPQEGLSMEGLSLASDFFLCTWPWPRALCPRLHLWYLTKKKKFCHVFFSVHVCGKEQLLIADVTLSKQFTAPAFRTEHYSCSLLCNYVVVAQENTRIRFWINDFGTERFGYHFYLRVCHIFRKNLHFIF